MYLSTITSLALLAIGAQAAPAALEAPPKGYAVFFSTFSHLNCDIASQGMTLVENDMSGLCQNMRDPALSLTVDAIKEGCKRMTPFRRSMITQHAERYLVTFYEYNNCNSYPFKVTEPGCFNSNAILSSFRVDCPEEN